MSDLEQFAKEEWSTSPVGVLETHSRLQEAIDLLFFSIGVLPNINLMVPIILSRAFWVLCGFDFSSLFFCVVAMQTKNV